MSTRPTTRPIPFVLLAVVVGAGLAQGTVSGADAANPASSTPQPATPWTGSKGERETVAQLMAAQRRKDRRAGARRNAPASITVKPRPGTLPPGSRRPGGSAPAPSRLARSVAPPKAPFAVQSSFLGAQISESGFVPPDSMGSVGPTQVLVAVNGRIKVFDKGGNAGPLNVSDGVFWSSVSGGAPISDPYVQYDRLSGRWFISMLTITGPPNSVMIAVSSGPTITGQSSFTFFSFQQDAVAPAGDTGLLADYDSLGVDANALYIGVNEFTPLAYQSSTGFVVRKSSVLGGGPLVAKAFRDFADATTTAGPFSPRGVQNMDPAASQGYFIGVDTLSFGQVDLIRVSDPGGTPSISGTLAVPVPATAIPICVPAQGTSTCLDAIDDRLFAAMIAKGPNGTDSLWTAHNVEVDSSGDAATGGGRDGARWYQIGNLGTTPSLLQSGTEFDPSATNPRSFFMPSIAENGQGHASLNSSMAGPGRFAEVAAMGRLATDAPGTTQPFTTAQSSTSPYDLTSTNPQRWGDYSQTVVDPADNMTFWSFQEYANAPNSWGVQVLRLQAPPPIAPVSASLTALPVGRASVAVQLTGPPSAGSGYFDPGSDPGGPGFPNHISAAVGGGVRVNAVTYQDPTHVALDLDTTGARAGPQNVTITNPDGQSASSACTLTVTPFSPSASITRHPKRRRLTRQGRTKIAFGVAGGACLSLQCRLDRKPFRICQSPQRYAVRPGRHIFRVRATDPAGATGAATRFRFRVIRRG